jgi:hypothetical protein
MEARPRIVKARITRTVTEIAIITLDRDGMVESVDDICDEIDYDNVEIVSIHSTMAVHG